MALLNQRGREKRGQISPSSAFSMQALDGLDDAHPHWGGRSTLTQSTDSTANFIQKHSEIMFNLGIPQSVKLTHKIHHHSLIVLIYNNNCYTSSNQLF